MPKTPRVALALLVLASLAGPVAAEGDAAAWLERLTARAEKGHYKVTTNAQVTVNQQGMVSTMQIHGTTNYASRELFNINVDMSMSMGGMDMEVSMVTVADGQDFWFETDSPMAGGKQVLTGKTADLDKYAEMGQANVSVVGGIGTDPASGVREIAEKFEMTVSKVEDGKVTLFAEVTPETAAIADLGPFAASLTHITLVLDQNEALPLQLIMGGEQPIMAMDFTDYEFFQPSDVQASDYTYTPPADVTVRDLSQFLGQETP